MNRRFKLICLKSEALSLELEEAEEVDRKYEKEFRIEFADATAYLMEKALEKQAARELPPREDIVQTTKTEKEIPILKNVYRSLARKTHPDITGSCDEEFKEIKKAYADWDIFALFSAAKKYDIKIDITDAEFVELEAIILKKKKQISKIKESVRWAWGSSQKTDRQRREILKNLGVNIEKFNEWSKTRS